jgi:BetI-type transcriptional repressor, C-terminal
MGILREGRPLDAITALLEEVLPLDPDRLTEAQVWAAFTAPPMTDPELAAIRAEADAGLRDLSRAALDGLRSFDLLHPPAMSTSRPSASTPSSTG